MRGEAIEDFGERDRRRRASMSVSKAVPEGTKREGSSTKVKKSVGPRLHRDEHPRSASALRGHYATLSEAVCLSAGSVV